MFYSFNIKKGYIIIDLEQLRFNYCTSVGWYDFLLFEDFIEFYKQNIIKPVFNYDEISIITSSYKGKTKQVSKEEKDIILEIWNTYKDLL